MSEPSDITPLLPQPFQTMEMGYDDAAEVRAVQRFLVRTGGPTIGMLIAKGGGIDGKFGKETQKAIEQFQKKNMTEPYEPGKLDIATARKMSEMRAEESAQDRRPDALSHIISQLPDLPRHPMEQSEGPHAMLRSAQYHAMDAVKDKPYQKPDPHVTRYVQDMLLARGYDLGPAGADGKAGKFTMAALQDYQRDAGLMPIGFTRDGGLDPATMELMRIDEAHQQQRNFMGPPEPEHAPAPAGGSISGLTGLADMVAAPAAGPEPAPAAAMPVDSAPAQTPYDPFPVNQDALRAADVTHKYAGPANLPPKAAPPQQQGGGFNVQIGVVAQPGLYNRPTATGIRIKFF